MEGAKKRFCSQCTNGHSHEGARKSKFSSTNNWSRIRNTKTAEPQTPFLIMAIPIKTKNSLETRIHLIYLHVAQEYQMENQNTICRCCSRNSGSDLYSRPNMNLYESTELISEFQANFNNFLCKCTGTRIHNILSCVDQKSLNQNQIQIKIDNGKLTTNSSCTTIYNDRIAIVCPSLGVWKIKWNKSSDRRSVLLHYCWWSWVERSVCLTCWYTRSSYALTHTHTRPMTARRISTQNISVCIYFYTTAYVGYSGSTHEHIVTANKTIRRVVNTIAMVLVPAYYYFYVSFTVIRHIFSRLMLLFPFQLIQRFGRLFCFTVAAINDTRMRRNDFNFFPLYRQLTCSGIRTTAEKVLWFSFQASRARLPFYLFARCVIWLLSIDIARQ